MEWERASRSDRQRLARCFGFEPMKPWGAFGGAAILAIIPWGTWVIAAPLALGITAMLVDENRKIADGLDEVKTWGFAIEGYRDWLLATSPAFDLELKRDVALDLITASMTAVDPSIVVQRRGERVVRVLMRRIEMEGGERQPTVFVGDRKRLHEVRDRVLGPLHADVGIVAMRMGDQSTLAALVATPQSATAEAAFRDQALVAPPELQSLAHAGTSQLRPPQEASSLKLRTDRLLYATGNVPASAGRLTLTVIGLTIVGGIASAVLGVGAGMGFLLGSVVGALSAWRIRHGDRRRLKEALQVGPSVEGYDNWLLSGRPIMDIEFHEPPPEDEVTKALSKWYELTWLTDRVVRAETSPVMHFAAEGIKSFWGGNPEHFEQAMNALRPLRERYGIIAIRMGGYLDRRA